MSLTVFILQQRYKIDTRGDIDLYLPKDCLSIIVFKKGGIFFVVGFRVCENYFVGFVSGTSQAVQDSSVILDRT